MMSELERLLADAEAAMSAMIDVTPLEKECEDERPPNEPA